MVTVLSIDGGGIRGIIPATFLSELEKRTGKPICELFDIIAGTSTGGILAATLTAPGRNGHPKYTAEQILSAYFKYGGAIFHCSLPRFIITLGGLGGPKYSPLKLESLLKQYLGEAKLHETLTDILVTAYDMQSSTPWFFKTTFARRNRHTADDPALAQVARATSAAPTFFPPLSADGRCFIDGGVFACNPALCAYAEARKLYPQEKEFFIVSLGTGIRIHNRLCSRIKKWGAACWAVPITDVMLNASSDTVDYELRALVGSENYERFQVRLDYKTKDMDNASKKNMLRLESIAKQAVLQQSAKIDRVCQKLKKTGY